MFAAALYAADGPIATVVSSFNTDKPVQRELLTNEGLVLLSEAGFSDSFIVEKILLSRTHFDISVEGLAFLRRKEISEELTLFVLKRATQPALAEPSVTGAPQAAAKAVAVRFIGPKTPAASVSSGPTHPALPSSGSATANKPARMPPSSPQ
jgi:hypothetical protein